MGNNTDCRAFVAPSELLAREHQRQLDYGADVRVLEGLSAPWAQVYGAMDALRRSLDQHNLMATQPAIAHDFVAVLASLAALRGDAPFEALLRAQLQRMLVQHQSLREPLIQRVSLPDGA